jgi:hypothetical protein
MAPTEDDLARDQRILHTPSSFVGAATATTTHVHPANSEQLALQQATPGATAVTALQTLTQPTMEELSKLDVQALCRLFQPTDDELQRQCEGLERPGERLTLTERGGKGRRARARGAGTC